jgi:hypothetical protein
MNCFKDRKTPSVRWRFFYGVFETKELVFDQVGSQHVCFVVFQLRFVIRSNSLDSPNPSADNLAFSDTTFYQIIHYRVCSIVESIWLLESEPTLSVMTVN